jgi:putative hydrolase of the HAD superfamily
MGAGVKDIRFIKAILFDADGVVIFPWRFARLLEREWGITPQTTRPFFRGIFDDCLVGKADLKAVLPPYLEQWGWPGTVDELVRIWLEVENAPDGRLIEAIQSLRKQGYLCGLATSQERNRAEYMKTSMRFSQVFDRLFFSCEIGAQKPDPAYYAAVTRALGLPGEAILFWDDNRQNVEAARQSGWQAEVYSDYETFSVALSTLQMAA